MDYLFSYVTSRGTVRKVNQDALLIKTALYRNDKIIFAVVCDGMGGLSSGEMASAYVIKKLSEWFDNNFSAIIKKDISDMTIFEIRQDLDKYLHLLNDDLNMYASKNNTMLGTTVTAFIVIPFIKKIIIAHAGDSRLYKITDTDIETMTDDHSIIAQDIRDKKITPEQARNDSRQNQITNAIGAGYVNKQYDYLITDSEYNCCYMLCSDGFCKKNTDDEILRALKPSDNGNSDLMYKHLTYLMNTAMQRKEDDNITAVMVIITDNKGEM